MRASAKTCCLCLSLEPDHNEVATRVRAPQSGPDTALGEFNALSRRCRIRKLTYSASAHPSRTHAWRVSSCRLEMCAGKLPARFGCRVRAARAHFWVIFLNCTLTSSTRSWNATIVLANLSFLACGRGRGEMQQTAGRGKSRYCNEAGGTSKEEACAEVIKPELAPGSVDMVVNLSKPMPGVRKPGDEPCVGFCQRQCRTVAQR